MSTIEKKFNAQETEKKWIEHWKSRGIYRFDKESTKQIFSVDTPPPYVSSEHLHIGHAMSYIQAEIIVRYKRMLGYNIFYPMGFDDNGLPTERFVEKKYRVDKRKITRSEFIALCLEETELGRKNYQRIWDRLGISVDWSLTYNTIGQLAQRVSQRSFLELYDMGLIYRQQAPNIWCTHCQTALAQADLDDVEAKSVMHFIRFSAADNTELTIATTRPEMLPACVSLYVHPDDSRYRHLIGNQARVPIFGQLVDIRTHSEVDMGLGTGVMMVCTWGDADDVAKWREDKLDTRMLIGPDGRLTEAGKHLAGLNVEQARERVVSELQEQGLILKSLPAEQRRNIHERCGSVVEFSLSWQWYLNLLKFKDQWLIRGSGVSWYPDFMKKRYDDWTQGLKWDWCISRDRYYGVPIPVWYCSDCDEPVLATYDDLPVDPREDKRPKPKCSSCGTSNLMPERQVLDTWMTSSLTPLINAHWGEPNNLMDRIYPMDLRVQAFEIIRTWFFYTIVKSHFHTDSIPWKSAMISGWGLDKAGKKMSKSKGNIVLIDFMVERYSADAIRWWSTNSGLGQNLRFSEADLQASKKLITKLWNVARFCQQHISDDEPSSVENISDQWILAELQYAIKECNQALEAYDFNKARIVLEKYFWQKHCDTYLELCKDRTWKPEQYDSNELESLRFTISTSLLALIKLLAPFLPFITEEIHSLLFDKNRSIHLRSWPETDPRFVSPELTGISEELLEIINRIRHFKTNEAQTFRSEISRLTLNTENDTLTKFAMDLKSLAGAREIDLNNINPDGKRYETRSCTLFLAL